MLDGEGVELYLTAWRVYDKLFIVWEVWTDDISTNIMQFDYNEFVNEYNTQFDLIKEVYMTHFDLDSMFSKYE
jgi:hypothetical protein